MTLGVQPSDAEVAGLIAQVRRLETAARPTLTARTPASQPRITRPPLLADPGAHAGAQYAPTGPQAMTVSDAADVIATITGQPIKYADIDRQAWIQASIAAGVPADYRAMLALLTETIASGHGSRPNNDIEQATGVPPTTFTDFVRRTAPQWIGAHQ